MKRKVVIGVLGTTLDKRGKNHKRWNSWRPTISICHQKDFPVSQLVMIHQPNDSMLASKITEDIHTVSPDTEVWPYEIDICDPWDLEEVYSHFLDFAVNYPFDTENEEYYVHITTGTHIAQICWFLLTEAHYLPAKLLQTSPTSKIENKDGAKTIQSATGSYAIIDLDLSRYTKLTSRFEHYHNESLSFLKSGIATRNERFNTLIAQIERVALRSFAPILLTGPTGAGKSFLAQRIYELRQSRHFVKGRFIAVNCATLRGDNAMSTLFGHVKGAFTGALQARQGLLREADKGILFLDEIAELGLDEQAMLLKAIEEKSFYPYGSDTEVQSDFQLIAGTHRDMDKQIAKGLFREDLYARINMWSFSLPGLVDRKEDIEPNIDYELHHFATLYQKVIRFNSDAKSHYIRFATSEQALWRGNFRELSASITRMATLAENGRITLALVEEEISRLKQSWGITSSSLLKDLDIDLFDLSQLNTVIKTCQQSSTLSEAGRKLFAVSRQNKKQPNDADRLRKYLAKFGLSWERIQHGE
ncbi:RNA repair transcriptional activator RtcR [Proteus vulgaris]|uniref:RNA repair transcriptional activator RtcR n=1 Tax=Proteus vulgaris TaxID=585 RepID=UPI0018CD4916|nr:RNA repair transcriptional activator RtcR [Proteus vulgaris]QPN89796.1 sigma 54-interacting transcriptional regulator [Proteus vulgaris]